MCKFRRWGYFSFFFSTGTIDEWRINNQRMQYEVEGENNKGQQQTSNAKRLFRIQRNQLYMIFFFISLNLLFSHRMSHPYVFFRFTNEHRHFISFLLICSFFYIILSQCVCECVFALFCQFHMANVCEESGHWPVKIEWVCMIIHLTISNFKHKWSSFAIIFYFFSLFNSIFLTVFIQPSDYK